MSTDFAELQQSVMDDNHPAKEPVCDTGCENSGNRNEFSETLGNILNGGEKKATCFARKPVNVMVTKESSKFFYIHC